MRRSPRPTNSQREHGLSAEIIDARSLVPFDYDPVLASVKKTGRILLVSEASERGSFLQTLAANIGRFAFADLKAPPRVLGSPNWIVPGAEMESTYFPQAARHRRRRPRRVVRRIGLQSPRRPQLGRPGACAPRPLTGRPAGGGMAKLKRSGGQAPVSEDASLRVRAAWLYYNQGLTQKDVSDRLGVSRGTIIRILAEAIERGDVQIWINAREAECVDLAVRLEAALGLDEAVVVPVAGGDAGEGSRPGAGPVPVRGGCRRHDHRRRLGPHAHRLACRPPSGPPRGGSRRLAPRRRGRGADEQPARIQLADGEPVRRRLLPARGAGDRRFPDHQAPADRQMRPRQALHARRRPRPRRGQRRRHQSAIDFARRQR